MKKHWRKSVSRRASGCDAGAQRIQIKCGSTMRETATGYARPRAFATPRRLRSSAQQSGAISPNIRRKTVSDIAAGIKIIALNASRPTANGGNKIPRKLPPRRRGIVPVSLAQLSVIRKQLKRVKLKFVSLAGARRARLKLTIFTWITSSRSQRAGHIRSRTFRGYALDTI